jgi:hypothetical protein
VPAPFIYLALPVMDEQDYLPAFIECLRRQTISAFELVACVNQPDAWWDDEDKRPLCLRNNQSLEYLQDIRDLAVAVIDRTTQGQGWHGKDFGVGWARRVVMDAIDRKAQPYYIIVSIDADTVFNDGYLQSILGTFSAEPGATALAVPYYHRLTGDAVTDRCVLRYEIYMRHYALNMWRIANPYRYTAIGSAMALPVRAYRAVRGITPHKSGEDFYFMQKLCKHGRIIHWNKERVYPAARFSDRVFFGTGPAMIKGRLGDWSSYPIYSYDLFDDVKETFDAFPTLFEGDVATPMDDFLKNIFGTKNIWQPLRENYRTREKFVRACTAKVDGLRIVQYMKTTQKKIPYDDAENMKVFLKTFYLQGHLADWSVDPEAIDFDSMDLDMMDRLRNFLAYHEDLCRQSGS